ncbi:winged helix DNA-binding protein [Polyangium sp. 15x6]|uniref:winged helix DNA-binding protein n=1 Tax=Polyangium sp. 15x6 TaxID=3042687 RepID=UPI00249B9F12|nr:winged helix DNA-binding protein [Polyangium sp. 15x6]MDI3292061.1 winged helix DNA-binding protein [Polyangium sp. 15x6]
MAQTLVKAASSLAAHKDVTERKLLARWLNSPILGTLAGSVGVSIAGFGGSLGGSKPESANTGEGFRTTGIQKLVKDWLAEIFAEPNSGGVVCVLDNLELLQTSESAREQLEVLRDEILTLPGLRWVLCGALGIVHGVASSPRLEGTLYDPIDLSGIPDSLAREVLISRVEAFGVIDSPYLPLEAEHFSELYHLMRGNLRAALSHADEYSQSIADAGAHPDTPQAKSAAFAAWLDSQTQKYNDAAASQLGPTAWGVFDQAIKVGGGFSPSSFADFGFKSIAALRPHVRDLEQAGLLVSTRDDGDRRRKTVRVTPKGWFVNRARTRNAQ